MSKARDLSDIVSNLSANSEKAVVVNSGGTELTFGDAGSSDLYGFVKTNGTGSQKEVLIVHFTNGADNLSVANADGKSGYDKLITLGLTAEEIFVLTGYSVPTEE